MEQFFNILENENLFDANKFSINSEKILKLIYEDRNLLKTLINSFIKNPELISLSEHYDFFDKLVLYKDPIDRFRIRLHIFSGEKHNNRPHNHRWNYSAIILNGYYKQYIYGTEDFINNSINPNDLKPIFAHEFHKGICYTIANNVFHSIDVIPNTVSIMLRGTSLKNRFLVFDKLTNRKWFEYERESETIEEIKRKSMSIKQINNIIEKVYEIESD